MMVTAAVVRAGQDVVCCRRWLLFVLLLWFAVGSAASAVAGDVDQEGPQHASAHFGRVAFSPSGEQLAAAHGSEVRIWDVAAREVVKSLELEEKQAVQGVAWSPDGKRIAVRRSGSKLTIHDVGSGKRRASVTGREWPRVGRVNTVVPSFRWLPSGNSLIVAQIRGFGVWHLDEQTAPRVVVAPGDLQKDRSCGWSGDASPGGKRFALADEHGGLRVWEVTSGKLLVDVKAMKACQMYVAWSPDGNRIALSSSASVRIIEPSTGETIRSIATPEQSSIMAWSPDGKTLAVAQGWLSRWSASDKPDKKITLLAPDTGEPRHTLNSQVKNIDSLAWSPDSSLLASVGSSKHWERDEERGIRLASNPQQPVLVWSVKTGELIERLPPPAR